MLYSVVVRPERWNGPLDELARELAPALDMRPDTVSMMLARGAMTAEADLTRGQAERLARSMASHGIPAEVVDHSGAVSLAPDTASRASAPANPAAPAVDLFDDLEPFVDVDVPLEADFDLTSELDLSRELMDFDSAPAPAADPAPAAPDSGGAWGSLFPDLSPDEDRPAEETPVVAAPQPVRSPPVVDLGADDFGASDPGTPDFGSTSVTPAHADRPAPPDAVAPPSQIASTGIPGAARYETGRTRAVPERAPTKTSSSPRPSPRPSPGGRDHVDALDLARALGDTGQAPPFAPVGFDDRVPHSIEFAIALSILAPGAGQVYNGQDEKGSSTLFWFFTVVPWVKSVIQARDRARKIATYWAPWPEPGSFKRAARHALVFYVVVIALGSFASWTLGKVAQRQERQEQVAQLALLNTTVDFTHTRTLAALDAAVDEMTVVEAEIDATRLTDDERAAALYTRSLSMCEAFMFRECAAAMRRVNELTPGYKGAARLQAWANFRLSGAAAAYPLLEPGSRKAGADAGADDTPTPDAGDDTPDDAPDAGAPPLEVDP